MKLLPYLRIESDHVCSEIFNNCRVLAYITNAWNPTVPDVWRKADLKGCSNNCCSTFDEKNYTFPGDLNNNPAPWYDPNVPASGEVFGFLVDLDGFDLEPADGARLSGFLGGGHQQATITGSVIASTERGNNYFVRWMKQQLNSCCRSCAGLAAEMFETCAPSTDVCFPGDSLTIGAQEIPVEQPYKVCYTPFAFSGADVPTLFSNVCPTTLLRNSGGSDFSAYDLPSSSQMAGATTTVSSAGCAIEVRGRDSSDIPGDRDLFKLPLAGGPIDGEMTIKFTVAQEDGDMGFALYDTNTSSWVPFTSYIGQGDGVDRGSHLQIASSGSGDATGVWVLKFNADGLDADDLQLIMWAMGQNEDQPEDQELITNIRYTYTGLAPGVPDVEHGGGCGGWVVNDINVDPDVAGSTWTSQAQLLTWMNTNDPNGVVWEVVGDDFCSTVELDPTVAGQYGNVTGCDNEVMAPQGDGARYDPDPDPIPLEEPLPYLDLGRRSLSSFRFVSMDELQDTDDFGGCWGRRYVIVMDTLDKGVSYGDSLAICRIDTWKSEWVEPAVTRVARSSAIGCANCGIPCSCASDPVTPTEVSVATCFVSPGDVVRGACLTNAIPDGIWTPVIHMRNPSTTRWVSNLTFRIVKAIHNAPSILNQTIGELWYKNQIAEVEGDVVGIAPGSTLILDGRKTRPEVECFNGEIISGAGVVFSPEGRAFRMPSIGCGTYWFEVSLSAETDADGVPEYGTLDLEVDLLLAPVLEVV